jgi:hypothetical protein
MYRRISVLVIQLQKRPHRLSLSRLSKIAVMVKSLVYLIIRDSQAHKGLLNLLDYLSLLSFFIWYLYGTGTGISSCFLYY